MLKNPVFPKQGFFIDIKKNQTPLFDFRIRGFGGGRGWIRTTEVADGRFTVCSLWPLGNPSVYIKLIGGDDWSW